MRTSKRRPKVAFGSLLTEKRKGRDGEGYEVWVYRHFDTQVDEDGHKPRLKEIIGRTDQITEDEAWSSVEHLWMAATATRPRATSVTMRGLINRYIHEILEPCLVPLGGVQSRKARMSHGCATAYIGELRNWVEPTWGMYNVRDFERREMSTQIEQWLPTITESEDNPSGRADSAMKRIHSVMRLLFKWGVKWGYIDFNPMADDLVELPRGATSQQNVKKAPQLNAAQFLLLLANLGVLGNVIAAVVGWLGSRRNEGFGLKWQDFSSDYKLVSFEQGVVAGRTTLLKTKATRTTFPVPRDVAKLLCEWREITPYTAPEDWVFASPHTDGKRPFWPDSLMKYHIQPVCEKLGLPRITWHSFRHSASEWAKRALKLQEAKEYLRHEKISTTSELYGGMSLEDKTTIQNQLVSYVKKQAKRQGWNGNSNSAKRKTTRNPSGRESRQKRHDLI